MKFHIIINLAMTCKVLVISIWSFYSTKCYKKHLDGWMTCLNS